jgi:SAM-dependent methyltransferase
MIELLSEEKIRSYDYLRIQCEFNDIWNRLFMEKYLIDRVLLGKWSKYQVLLNLISRSRLTKLFFIRSIVFKYTEYMNTHMNSDRILHSNKLGMTRSWEYPWAILNSDITQDTKILDVGSGASLLPLYLAQKSNHVDSLDSDEYQMRVLSPTLADILKFKVNYLVDDATHLPAEDDTYDYVFCISVLEHLEETKERGVLVNRHPKKLDRLAIREFLRVIKPGGRVILTLDYANKGFCTGWFQVSFEFDYVKELAEEFSTNLLEPLPNFDSIRLTPEREREIRRLWSEFYDYRPLEDPLGTALGIILTKQ